uniref:Uncharacterized protein n=1 Tax=Arundo donax TaxID=35708 RepID=A0A0A9DSH6_ARUDO
MRPGGETRSAACVCSCAHARSFIVHICCLHFHVIFESSSRRAVTASIIHFCPAKRANQSRTNDVADAADLLIALSEAKAIIITLGARMRGMCSLGSLLQKRTPMAGIDDVSVLLCFFLVRAAITDRVHVTAVRI